MTQDHGAAEAPSRTLELGGRTVTVERVSGRKAQVAFTLIRQAGVAVKSVAQARATFVNEFEQENTASLTRVQARVRFPPRPLVDELGLPMREPDDLPDPEGDGTIPNPRAGELIMAPSPIDGMTDADWEASGGRLELPRSPSKEDVYMALLPEALEHGEETVYRLLALFSMSNEEVAQARKSGDGVIAELDRRVEDLLDDALLDELVELAVIASEVVDDQFRRKAARIGGDRLGKALKAIGIDLPSNSTSPSSTSDDSIASSSNEPSTEERQDSSSSGAEPSQDGGPMTSLSDPTASSSSSASFSRESD